jgi:outer membrane protein TolC
MQVLVNRPVDRLASLDEARLNLSPPNPDDPQNWIELAEQASPELRALRARAQAAAFEVEKARAGHLPTLDATAQWSRSTSDSISNIETTNDVRSFGLQLNIPIYSGGGVNSAMRQALANKERAEQIVEATRRDLEVKVFKEFRGVSEGVLRVRALEQAVKSAELALMSNQRSFQAGNRTRIDVMNAESGKMLALRDLAQARYIYLISWLRLKALVAQADEHSIEVINSSLAVVDQ